ncbi:hypothetical protein K438DRAFT_1759981 [Mycena galopus ATCC 62051]|nr:hypothetical protein K438DRAFT_1759981 [Mycena galopus ATCC 62051]
MRPGLTNQSSVTFRSTKPTGKAGSARPIRRKRGTQWLDRPDGYRVRDEVGGSHVPDRQLDLPGGDAYGTRMGHPEVVEVEMELNVEVEKSMYRAVGEEKSPMHLVSARTKEVQENSEPAFDDRHHDRERRDLRDDRQESDSDSDSGNNDNDEDAQKKRKRSSGKVCTNPRQEGFYPASWKKVFARAKDLVYIYLLLHNLFPEWDEFKSVQISSFLHDAMLYVDTLGIPLEKKYKKHLTKSDDMVELDIVKTEYRAIFPDQAQFRGRDEWIEKVKSNVEKLLEGSSYHEHGVDAQGQGNNLMHPAFERLAQSILSMGRRPLGQEFPEEFQKYRPKFIIAIMIFVIVWISPHSRF